MRRRLQESPARGQSEGKSLLDALTRFVYGHRQEIKTGQMQAAADNLLQSMKQLVSGFEQLTATESTHVKGSTLRQLVREAVRQALIEGQDTHRDGDVWYEKSRAGYTPTHGEGMPWGGRYDGKVLYFFTQKAASRYADQGSGKLVDDVNEAMTTVDLSKQAGMGAGKARGYKQRCTHCGSTETVVTYSADSALDQLKKDGWLVRTGGSLCPHCAKSAVTKTEASYGNVNPLSRPVDYGVRCKKCGETARATASSPFEAFGQLKDQGWQVGLGKTLCPQCAHQTD